MAGKSSSGRKTTRSNRSKPKSSPKVRLAKRVGLLVSAVALAGCIIVAGVFMSSYKDAPERMDLLIQKEEELNKVPSKILSADGKVLYQVSTENRDTVKFSEIPKVMQNAILAAEDVRFYQHSGVDSRSLMRSLWEAVRNQRATQGGSTITMQLAKLLSDGSKRSLNRKVDDISLAIYMERQMTKDQILALYLNYVYFGEGAHGIAAAAKVYFGKELSELSLSEAAMLARCVRSPSSQNPIRNFKKAMENRDVVLGTMLKENMIDDEEYKAALASTPRINRRPQRTTAILPNGAEYFVDHVKDLLKTELPGVDLKDGGYTIETTLDSRIEKHTEQLVAECVAQNHGFGVNTAAFLVMDRDGEILAEVGGVNYRKSSYNYVEGKMPPGSGFKPIVYATAFKEGVLNSPEDQVSNAFIKKVDPSVKGGYWIPHNDEKAQNSPTYSARRALSSSINLPAIHTIQSVGPEKVVAYARDFFGFTSTLHAVDSLALGTSDVSPLEMAQAYSVFMLKGDRATPFAIKRIIGPDGTVIRDYQPQIVRNVFDPAVCDKLDSMLGSVVTGGTAAQANIAAVIPNAHGKTGTTQKNTDLWFTGYADGLLGVGWCADVAKDGGRHPMSRHAFGGNVTAPLWRDVMKYALKIRPQAPVVDHQMSPDAAADKAAASKFANGDGNDVPPDDSTNPDNPANQKPVIIPPTNPDTTAPPGPTGTPASPSETPETPKTTPDTPGPSNSHSLPDSPNHTKNSDDAEYVDVDICEDTGLRATMYCPDTFTKRFKKGTEPKKYCTLHTGNAPR